MQHLFQQKLVCFLKESLLSEESMTIGIKYLIIALKIGNLCVLI
jgi:hypothetical protein